ncbi:MAG: hypothetical protein ABIQ51_08945 [Mesorhizobium sp.]
MSSPVEYGASLSPQDPKFVSPECQKARVAASDYAVREKEHPGWGTGVFLGPYGLGIAAAIKEHEQKERKIYARAIYAQCSSLPLPRELEGEASPPATTKYP